MDKTPPSKLFSEKKITFVFSQQMKITHQSSSDQLTLQGILIDTIRSEIPEKTEWPLPVPSKTKINRCGGLPDYLNRVYNGAIMKILKDLPDDSVDMVFGDPDYNVGIKYGRN